MTECWLVRKLAPLFDYYVNDAFSAAPRLSFHDRLPGTVASAAGDLLFTEYSTLSKVLQNPAHPSVFVLGSAKISDAFA